MDDKKRAEQRKKRQKEKKRNKAGKVILSIISIIIIALASFLITMKLCDPDFTVKSIIPMDKVESAVVFVKEDIFNQTTTTSTTTTKPTTTKPKNYDYDEFSEFAFDTSMQGNQIGNLLNKSNGAVTYSSAYIYYSIDGKGLYRFEPNSETNAQVNVKDYHYTNLNILGDYLYFIDTKTNKLRRSQITGGDMLDIATDISFSYLYSDKVYYIGTDNSVGYINTKDFEKKSLYKAPAGKELSFVGISLSNIFFTQYDTVADYYEYIAVDIEKGTKRFFRDDSRNGEIINMQLEGGFFYYYEKQADGSYSLIRQKFGSEKTVKLLEKCKETDYPVIYDNRLYYLDKNGSVLSANELNMNSMDKKTMVRMYDADDTASVGVGYGYQYVFLFGKPKSSSDMQYRGSCIYTSASAGNTIKFNGNGWKY